MIDLFSCAGSILLSSVILLSFLLKLRERGQVKSWISENISRKFGNSLFATILLLEALLIFIVLCVGSKDSFCLIGVSSLMLLLACLAKFVRRNKGANCPCFGSASLAAGVETDTVFFVVFVMISVEAILSRWLYLPVFLYCTFIMSMIVGIYFFSQKIFSKVFMGLTLDASMYPGVDTLSLGMDAGRPVALVFLSTKCRVCMSFLKYLEMYSERFESCISLRLVIDGLDVAEETSFGGAVIIPCVRRELANTFKVYESPSMIIWSDSKLVRYRGIQACNLGLSELVRTRLSL